MKKSLYPVFLVLFGGLFTAGAWGQFGDFLKSAGNSGLFNGQTGQVIQSLGTIEKARENADQNFTPQQEYYLGRAVGAQITSMYKIVPIGRATLYLNALVQVLAAASDMPTTYGGYHVLILDSETVNALSCPGGLIFVTKGMLRCATNETTLAAVFAHEIGHIEHRDGVNAIKKARQTEMWTVIGKEAAKNLGNQQLKQATQLFGDSVADVVKTMVNDGYSREQESNADSAAVDILRRAGYNPVGLVQMLERMKKFLKPGGNDFAKTHPSPDVRIAAIRAKIGTDATSVDEPPMWTARFHAEMDGLLSRP